MSCCRNNCLPFRLSESGLAGTEKTTTYYTNQGAKANRLHCIQTWREVASICQYDYYKAKNCYEKGWFFLKGRAKRRDLQKKGRSL